MGFWDFIRPSTGYVVPDNFLAPIIDGVTSEMLHTPVDELWRTQPYLRTVVTFIARNIAQVGLHVLEREDDGGRRRVREGRAAELLRRPSSDQTMYELMFDLVATLALYDEAVLWVKPWGDKWEMRLIRPSWVLEWSNPTAFSRGDAVVHLPGDLHPTLVAAEALIVFHGWDPVSATNGSSPVATLRTILAEQWEAQAFRLQMWKKGGKIGSYLTRPKDAPDWPADVRKRFADEFRAAHTGRNGGGVPLLEDGMELKRVGFSAHEEDFVDGSKLALTTVASAYHINPTMLGLLDNANYSNVREFRRMLYGDSLGPILKQIEDRLNAFLLPMMGERDSHYLEFNLQEKLRGSFEEQARVYNSAIGGPWMTVNEGRSRENLPTVEGGDDLIRPLNVGVAGDSPPDLDPGQPDPLDEMDGES